MTPSRILLIYSVYICTSENFHIPRIPHIFHFFESSLHHYFGQIKSLLIFSEALPFPTFSSTYRLLYFPEAYGKQISLTPGFMPWRFNSAPALALRFPSFAAWYIALSCGYLPCCQRAQSNIRRCAWSSDSVIFILLSRLL